MKRRKLIPAIDLAEGQTHKFEFRRDGRVAHGFVARFNGELVAYENRCRHLPLSLDYDDNRFFTADGAHFICQTHGAIYEPASGLCVRGPCQGDSLVRLPIELRDGVVWLLL